MSTEFQWTDELIQEYAEYYRFSSSRTTLEQFKASKQPKPEWEIVSLKDTYYNQIITAQNKLGIYRLEDYLVKYPKDRFNIYSVKRLSDGTLWSINDKFSANAGCDLTIKSFEVDGCGMKIWSVEYGYWPLNSINKIAVLTTEDGVSIRDGDDVWFCNTKNWDVSFVLNLYEYEEEPDLKYFSTKEKAEEYRYFNQPLISVKDALSDWDNNFDFYKKRLIALAKDKLNPNHQK